MKKRRAPNIPEDEADEIAIGEVLLKMKPMRSQLEKFFRSNRSQSSKIGESAENR